MILLAMSGLQGLYAQTSIIFDASGTFIAPPCVTSVQVECWGGGGAGGGSCLLVFNDAGGGGGGGGYTLNPTVSVTPGNSYTITIGAGGTGAVNANGGNGGTTTFNGGSVSAAGGRGGSQGNCGLNPNNGAGGSGGVGGTHNGGNGASGQHDTSPVGVGGGGGGGAGSGGNGLDGNNNYTPGFNTYGPGGPGTNPGGDGGNGGHTTNGFNGSVPGGGGGGSNTNGPTAGGTSSWAGGNGGHGRVIITYTAASSAISSVTGSGCPGSTININGTGFSGVSNVRIGSTALTGLSVNSTVITGTIAPGTTSGYVMVTTPCGTDSSTSVFTVYPAPALVNLGTHSICPGSSFAFGGRVLTNAGLYTDTSASVATGCDSFTQISLTLIPLLYDTFNQSVCTGSAYSFAGQSYVTSGYYNDTTTSAVSGCDSISTLHLVVIPFIYDTLVRSICLGSAYSFGGQSYSAGGYYNDTTTSAVSGCDSISTLNLRVISPVYAAIAQTICQGGSYAFGGHSYSTSGIYIDTTISVATGCDSITTLTLNVIPPVYAAISRSVCLGSSYTFGGHNYSVAGNYIDTTLSAITGCDSITTLTLSVISPVYTAVSQSICLGSRFTFGGHSYSAAGSYNDTTLSAVTGCDSITTLTLSVISPVYTGFSQAICQGSSYTFGGHVLSTAGVYLDTATSYATGCDSITALNLTLILPVLALQNHSICPGSSYTFGGHTYTAAGTYLDTVTAFATGCDSITTLNLIVATVVYDTLRQALCSGGSYAFGSLNLSTAGVYNDTATTTSGCDSITTLLLTINPPLHYAVSGTICAGSNYLFNGISLTGGGAYSDTLSGLGGCDSIVDLTLTVLPTSALSITDTINLGDSVQIGGRNYSQPGLYADTLAAVNGCDSIINLDLIVRNARIYVLLYDTLCPGGSFVFDGRSYTQAGAYADTVPGVLGGDSIISINITVDHVSVNVSASGVSCYGYNNGSATATVVSGISPYQYLWSNGSTQPDLSNLPGGFYTLTITDSHLCSASGTASITEPAYFSERLSAAAPTCSNSQDGMVTDSVLGGTAPYAYTLESASGSPLQSGISSGQFTGLAPGDYQVLATDQNGCTTTANISVPPARPNYYSISADSTSCNGSQYQDGIIHIVAYQASNAPFQFSIDGSAYQFIPDFFDLVAGPHQLSAKDRFGCDTTFTVNIAEPLPATLLVLPADSIIVPGQSVQLSTVFGVYSTGAIKSYAWSPATGLSCDDCPAPVASPYSNQAYSLVVTYNKGCTVSTTVQINTDSIPPTYIPNAFSPNGDGTNDLWMVYGNGIASIRAAVYDRWGEKVFETDQQSMGWDGNYEGRPMPAGEYVYIVNVLYLGNRSNQLQGSLTLLR